MPEAAAPDTHQPALHSRVQLGDCKATVKYVGKVQAQTGVWIGLEWDDKARGKNDGKSGGCQYFDCRQPGAGSFLRQEKFALQAVLGGHILASLQERYRDQSTAEQLAQTTPGAATQSIRRKGVEWQFVGADKVQAKLSVLEALDKASLISSQVAAVVRLS